MVDWRRLGERYRRLAWEQRVGNLASTLARSATASANPRAVGSVDDLLREAMWIIEWSAGETNGEALAELAEMQRELGLLHRAWRLSQDAARPLVRHRARALSDQALRLSGLLSE